MGENGRQAHGQRLFLRGEAGCTRAKIGFAAGPDHPDFGGPFVHRATLMRQNHNLCCVHLEPDYSSLARRKTKIAAPAARPTGMTYQA